MISRRQFVASGASLIAGSVALASRGLQDEISAPSGKGVSISETFTPPEWLKALESAVDANGNVAEREFWRAIAAWPQDGPWPTGELPLLGLPAPGLEPFAPELARRLAIASNDRLSQRVRESQGALAGLASVSAFDPQCVREAERAVMRLGMVGLSLGANRGMRLGNRQLWPLYEFAQATRTPIYLPAGYCPGAGDAPYRAMRREGVIDGAATDSSSHAFQLIFGGVLDAFPKLNFILGRLGESAPHWYGELAAAKASFESREVRAPQREVQEYFHTNLFLTTADMVSPATLRFCQSALGAGRILRVHQYTRNGVEARHVFDGLTQGATLDSLRRSTLHV